MSMLDWLWHHFSSLHCWIGNRVMSTPSVRTDPAIRGSKDDLRKSYTTPHVKLLGTVRDLTHGGSLAKVESNGHPTGRL